MIINQDPLWSSRRSHYVTGGKRENSGSPSVLRTKNNEDIHVPVWSVRLVLRHVLASSSKAGGKDSLRPNKLTICVEKVLYLGKIWAAVSRQNIHAHKHPKEKQMTSITALKGHSVGECSHSCLDQWIQDKRTDIVSLHTLKSNPRKADHIIY